jgi:hypothetical protein
VNGSGRRTAAHGIDHHGKGSAAPCVEQAGRLAFAAHDVDRVGQAM